MRSEAIGALLCLLGLVCGACLPPPQVRMGADVRLRAFRRLLVPPFSDDRGLGEEYARELSKGLWELGFDVVGGDQTAASLKALGIRRGEALGGYALRELRGLTRADAAVVGHVSCPDSGAAGRITVLVLEAEGGETVLQVDHNPRACGSRAAVGPAMAEVLRSIERALRSKGQRAPEDESF